jgi:hypothetical protein
MRADEMTDYLVLLLIVVLERIARGKSGLLDFRSTEVQRSTEKSQEV